MLERPLDDIARRFQAAMLDNDWLCDSMVGHEAGTCLGCITVALDRSLPSPREAHRSASGGDEDLLREARDVLWHDENPRGDRHNPGCIGCVLESRIDAYLAAARAPQGGGGDG